MTDGDKGRRRRWPYALALLALIPASLALPLRSGYIEAKEARAAERERVVVASAGRPATWKGATWRLLGISEIATEPGSKLPTGGTHVLVALAVTPHDRASAKRLEDNCEVELRDQAGRIWTRNDQFIPFQLRTELDVDLPAGCRVEEEFTTRPIAPGEEHLMYSPFVIPRAALGQVEPQVVLASQTPPRSVLRFAR